MRRKWLLAGLVVSVALNLALIGFLAGTAGGPPAWRTPGFDPAVGLARLVRFLPDERRDELLDRSARREIGASLRDMRRAQRAMHEALAADTFDRAALAASLGQFRDHFAASQARSHAAFVEIAAHLTPQERRRFVQSQQRGKKSRRRDDRDH